MPADSRDMVLVPREPTEEMIWEGALAAMEAATEFIEDGFWKDRHLRAIERMRSGDYGSEDDHAKGLKVGSALYRAALSASPARGEGDAPVPVTIFCPVCSVPHVDEGEWATTRHHKTHQCQSCGHEWRPFPFATVGVAHPTPATPEGAENDADTLAVLLDNVVIAQSLSRELRERAHDEARSYLYDRRQRLAALQPQAEGE